MSDWREDPAKEALAYLNRRRPVDAQASYMRQRHAEFYANFRADRMRERERQRGAA